MYLLNSSFQLRAQASVLKKAVIDEQNKNSSLREVLRQRETSLRRAEQEVDSLSFRNKQLELRVASLQEDFEKEVKKSTKNQKVSNKVRTHENVGDAPNHSETILAEELQKKIMENAQLTSLVSTLFSNVVETFRINLSAFYRLMTKAVIFNYKVIV